MNSTEFTNLKNTPLLVSPNTYDGLISMYGKVKKGSSHNLT
jgi:hypothetical protein